MTSRHEATKTALLAHHAARERSEMLAAIIGGACMFASLTALGLILAAYY